MVVRALSVILFGSLCCGLAVAQTTQQPASLKLTLKGLDGSLEENAKAWLTPLQKTGLSDSATDLMKVEKALRLALRALGYYQPTIRFTRTKADRLTVEVSPGTPVKLVSTNVNITGEGADDRIFRLASQRVPKPGTVLNHGDYEQFKQTLSNVALHRGYFDAEFHKSELGVSLPRHEAVWTIDYETGPRWSFGPVTYKGSQIDTRFLDNMKPFKTGEPYNADTLGEFNQRLAKSGWFTSAVVAPDFQAARDANSTELPFQADVVPRKANLIETGLGFATDTGPHGKVNWVKPWVNRRGHSMSASTSISADEQQMDFSYKLPRITNPLEEYWLLQSALKHTSLNDTDSNNLTLALSRNWEFSTGWQRSIGAHIMYDSFTQAGISNNTLLFYPGISFSRTRARGGTMPYWGDSQRYSIDVSTEYLGSDVDFAIFQAHWTFIRSPAQGHRFVLRGGAGKIKTNRFTEVPPDLRFFAGGDRSVRGYDYESISPRDNQGRLTGASAMVTGSVEYQYRVTGKWWGAAFIDAGDASNSFANFHWKKGAGVGVRWNSPVGPVKFDIARPIGDPDHKDFQFYIGLGAEL